MLKTLLLADDSLTIHRVVELTFADEDYQVISVSNGNQAIEKINVARPDIIIADVNMPEKDGYEVCAYVKSNPQLASIPVILLKGTFEPFDQARADAVRADGIIQKPFQSQVLIDKVFNILGVVTTAAVPPRPPSAPPQRAGGPIITPPPQQPRQAPIPSAQPPQPEVSEPEIPFSPTSPQPQLDVDVEGVQDFRPRDFAQPGEQVGEQEFEVIPEEAGSPPVGQPYEFSVDDSPFGTTQDADDSSGTAGSEPEEMAIDRSYGAFEDVPPQQMKPSPPPPSPQAAPPQPEMRPASRFSQPPHIPKPPRPPAMDDLSQYASEAGRELTDAFSTPPAVQPDDKPFGTVPQPPSRPPAGAQPQVPPLAPPLPAGAAGQTPMPHIPEMKPSPPSQAPPQKPAVQIPDFSDASGDISMAFNRLSVAQDQSAEEIPPVFQQGMPQKPPVRQEPLQQKPTASGTPAGQVAQQPPQPSTRIFSPEEAFDSKPIQAGKEMSFEQKPPAQSPKSVQPSGAGGTVPEELADTIAKKVIEKLSADVIREISWEVVPEIAERVVKEIIQKHKQQD